MMRDPNTVPIPAPDPATPTLLTLADFRLVRLRCHVEFLIARLVIFEDNVVVINIDIYTIWQVSHVLEPSRLISIVLHNHICLGVLVLSQTDQDNVGRVDPLPFP